MKKGFLLTPLLLLLLLPVANLVHLPEKYSRFQHLPQNLILAAIIVCTIALALYIWPIRKEIRIDRHWAYGLIVAYTITFGVLSVLRHFSFYSTALDLGIYDQAVWGYSQGRLIIDTVINSVMLGDHAQPILFLVAPFYWIYSSPVTLLILQSIMIGLAALPLYWFAREKAVETAGFF